MYTIAEAGSRKDGPICHSKFLPPTNVGSVRIRENPTRSKSVNVRFNISHQQRMSGIIV